jgi:hypothetical protein
MRVTVCVCVCVLWISFVCALRVVVSDLIVLPWNCLLNVARVSLR